MIIDYGAAIWGTQEFACINAVQYRASRFFLRVGKYTPNVAVAGDMGWKFSVHKQWLSVTRHWVRMVNLPGTRVNKRVFLWGLSQSNNWCSRVRKKFNDLSMQHLGNVNYQFDPDEVLHDMDVVLEETMEQLWFAKLQREEAVRGQGRNKLRTYRLFKKDLGTEHYVKNVFAPGKRSALAKFRCGVAPIRLETGRYEGLPEDDRLCPFCNEVESETHVILNCELYSDLRVDLLNLATSTLRDFPNLTENDKLAFLLSEPNICILTAKTCKDILDRRLCFLRVL